MYQSIARSPRCAFKHWALATIRHLSGFPQHKHNHAVQKFTGRNLKQARGPTKVKSILKCYRTSALSLKRKTCAADNYPTYIRTNIKQHFLLYRINASVHSALEPRAENRDVKDPGTGTNTLIRDTVPWCRITEHCSICEHALTVTS